MTTMNVTCRLPSEAVSFLDKLGESMNRDRSYLIRDAVAHYVELQRWQLEEIDRGMADVRAGRFATEDEVRHALRRKPE